MSFVAGMIVGGMMSSGGGSSPPAQIYQVPKDSVAILCDEPKNQGADCIDLDYKTFPIITYACHEMAHQNKSCADYYVSNRFMIINSNGVLAGVLIEFTHVPVKK